MKEMPQLNVEKALMCHACAWVHAGETFGTEDPRTGEVYTQVAEAQEADVDAAVKAAREVHFSLLAFFTCKACSMSLVPSTWVGLDFPFMSFGNIEFLPHSKASIAVLQCWSFGLGFESPRIHH